MAIVQYTVKVRDSRLLELPEEAQELGLQAAEEIAVSVDRKGIDTALTILPNEKGLAAMREITERQENRPTMEGSDVIKLVRMARAGTMYGLITHSLLCK